MKRLLALLLALILVVGLAACGGGGDATPTPAPPTGGNGPGPDAPDTGLSDRTFRAAMTATPTSLDEGYSTNAHARHIASYIFETLFTFDDGFNIIPQLAEDYVVAEDGLSGTVTLRQGITFHDGSPFGAEDVVASVNRFNGTMLAGKLDAVTGMEIINNYEVLFTFDRPIALPQLMAFPQRVVMMPSHVAAATMDREMTVSEMIGTGPYRLIDWIPDVHVELERFEDYVQDERFPGRTGLGGRRIPYFQRIFLLPVPEAEARIAGLETGEFDFAEAIPNTSFNRINDNPDLDVSLVIPRWSIALEFNHDNGPASDVNFRRALLYALDMEEVLNTVTFGQQEFWRLNPSIYTPEQFFYVAHPAPAVYNTQDLARVQELLDLAGYNGEEVVYLVNRDFDFMYRASLSIAEQWQAAGINIVLEFNDWPTQIARAQTLENWAINQTALSPRLDPTQLASTLRTGALSGYGFSSPVMDDILDQLAISLPDAERHALWTQAQNMVWDEVIFLKIGDFFELEAINSRFDGFTSFWHSRFWNLTER